MVRRLIRCTALYLMLAATVWMAASTSLAPEVYAQEGPNRAAFVVRFDDGSVLTQCVSFNEPAISGAELLTRAGLQMNLDYNSGLGGAVCSIREQGCAFPAQDCFCQCRGVQCEYWAYYHRIEGRWQYSQQGASSYEVTDGALEGWSWGPGDFSSGTEPPQTTFDEVCASTAPAAAGPVTGSAGSRPSSLGDLLVSAVQAQELEAPGAAPIQPANSISTDQPLLPNYAVYLLFAAALLGASMWVLDRRKKAAAISASARRQS